LFGELLEHLLCLVETDFHIVVPALQRFDLLHQIDNVCIEVRILIVESFDFASACLTASAYWRAN
jgi:hypothetical protein